MVTPLMGNVIPEHRWWAADTGCFSNPAAHDPVVYLAWLAQRTHLQRRCLFATATDVVRDAEATLAKSKPMLPVIRAMGFSAALVAQDGLEHLTVPWESFDCLFIGGSTEWKLSERAVELIQEAKQRGKWTHMGRVNSLRRLRWCENVGMDSADGTFVAFGGEKNAGRVNGWLSTMTREPQMVLT